MKEQKINGWVLSAGEDGKRGVHGDVTVDRTGNGMKDGSWNLVKMAA